MAPSKQFTCAKHSLGYMAELHANLQTINKLKDQKMQQKQTHIESLKQAMQQQEQAYQQELDQLDQQAAMLQEQIQTMQAQTDKLNGGAATSATPSPPTPHATPMIQPAVVQEFTKRLTQQVFPDKATDTQTLDGFSQSITTLFSQLGLIHHQTNPSSSTSTAGDSPMTQAQQTSASKRELSPTAAAEELHKQPKETKTA
eukprot:1393551-Karenia_brevis.AAC.1